MAKRKAISDKMKWQALLYWNDIPCPECDQLLCSFDRIEWDHRQALIHGGEHDCSNIQPMHESCHTLKTTRDVKANAKVKRIAKGGRKRKGPKMKSRGFDKKKRAFPSRKKNPEA